MKFSSSKKLAVLLLVCISVMARAQVTTPEIQAYVENVTFDANTYMGHYISPILNGIGYGFNNGWYNTARPHKSFGFDLTISGNAALVPTIDQSFSFDGNDYKVFDTPDGNPVNLPTVMGETTTQELRSYIDKNDPTVYVQFPVLDGIQNELPINLVAVPSPIVQLGVGIYKGTEVKVRWVPTIKNSAGINYKYFGLGFMHSVSQWIPAVKDLEFLDISAFVGFTNVDLNYELTPGDPFKGQNQMADFGIKTITYEAIGSVTFSVFTGYVGIGFDNFKTNLNLNGDYEIKIPGTDTGNGEITQTISNPVAINLNDGGFRATAGVRLKLAVITFHGAYTLQGYNTLNVGVGINVR